MRTDNIRIRKCVNDREDWKETRKLDNVAASRDVRPGTVCERNGDATTQGGEQSVRNSMNSRGIACTNSKTEHNFYES